ncbi:MAG TPA: T9SS type A sorting domain-containing protein [Sediminibacterium sp.]|nr:T9SS type A sorting domain-containing protein [Sediminibacterium sp.]
MVKIFTRIALLLFAGSLQAQSFEHSYFLVAADAQTPLQYDRFSRLELGSRAQYQEMYRAGSDCRSRNNTFVSYQRGANLSQFSKNDPLNGSVACLAFDARHKRLFYVPLKSSELCFMDLQETAPSFTCLKQQSLNLLHAPDDVANQVSRMTIGADGFGYALSNDAEHLIRFSTDGNPEIRDLGVLVDDPKNPVLVRSSCTSWGGDMVGAADGSLYLITQQNHVFHITLPGKLCSYVGTIQGLPPAYTSNGAMADEDGNLVVSCGTGYGKNYSAFYTVGFPDLRAHALSAGVPIPANIADLASGFLLFQNRYQRDAFTNGIASNTAEVLSETDNTGTVRLFPNPVTQGRFQLQISKLAASGNYTLQIIDAAGKTLQSQKVAIGAKTATVQVKLAQHTARGVYVAQLLDEFNRSVYSRQFIVE